MIYLELFLGFLKVGLFSFGGAYSAIPIVRDVVISNGWMTDEALSYMIAVGESTPGPIMINLATFAGSKQAGILGALTATFAVVLPAFVIILLISLAMKAFIGNKYVQAVLGGLKPCVTGIILAIGAFMIWENVFSSAKALSADIRATALTLILSAVFFGAKYILKKKISPILLIVISAALGIGIYSI